MNPRIEKKAARREAVGRIKVHPDGFGFVSPEDGETADIYVGAQARANALDGDRVSVEWWEGPRGLDGRILRVLERGRTRLTGEVHPPRGFVADDPRVTHPIVVKGDLGAARSGHTLLATIVRYPSGPGQPIEVSIERVLGAIGDPRTEVEKILVGANVSESFTPAVARLAAAMPTEVRASDRQDRADLRAVPFTTIDPETARDFDDAVAWEPSPDGGGRLWVAVADVSHYVEEGSPIDQEALARGCSIYLPNRAIPMLPESLSAHICSLLPEQDRLAMVVRIDFDPVGAPRASDFSAAVIHSRARLDYPGVAAALGDHAHGRYEKYAPFLPALRAMDGFAKILRARRFARGALELDLPEPVVDLDGDDPSRVRGIRRSRKDPGERGAYAMIEEFMLAANEAVARSFTAAGEPTLWRIHARPDQDRLATFGALAESYGVAVDLDRVATPAGLRDVLRELKGHPAEKALSFQLLRSLKQATYDLGNVGHFGLAATDYVHFTSPIRRYPDLVVHRLLKRRLATLGKPSGGFQSATQRPAPSPTELGPVAAQTSARERAAMEIERETVDMYRTFFMRDRVGDTFTGTISAVTGFGVFVTLDEPFIEGLVRMESLPRDAWTFDERRLTLTGARTGRVLRLGDEIAVEVENVSVQRRKIDFRLAGLPAGERARGPVLDGREAPRRTRQDRSFRIPVHGERRETTQHKKPGGGSHTERTRGAHPDKASSAKRPRRPGRGGKPGRRKR